MGLYRATAGMAEGAACLTTDWVLGGFAKTKNVARQHYRDFVQQGKGQPSPGQCLKNQIYLGDDEFVFDMQGKLVPEQSLKDIPKRAKASANKTHGLFCQSGNNAK